MGLGATLPNHIPACKSEFCGGGTSMTNVVLEAQCVCSVYMLKVT